MVPTPARMGDNMTGLEILATVPAQSNWVIIVIAFLLAAILIIATTYLVSDGVKFKPSEAFMAMFGVFMIAFTIGILMTQTHEAYYIAKLDSTAPYIEMEEKYNVLEHYDNIYFLRDKKKDVK